MTDPRPACAGQWQVMDSVDPADHRAAKALCAVCPMLAECGERLDLLLRTAPSYGLPEGTWAGEFFESSKRQHPTYDSEMRARERLDAEEVRYSEDQAREARSAYHRGERTAWVIVGNRVYNRRKKRSDRRQGSAA